MSSAFSSARRAVVDERAVCLATVVSGDACGESAAVFAEGQAEVGIRDPELAAAVVAEAERRLAEVSTGLAEFALEAGPVEVFFDVQPPPEKLVIVGAVHVAIPLVEIASALGLHTVVIDAREPFATRERFPHADELIVGWPADALATMTLHRSTSCVFLTHDAKIDNPGLAVALASEARYVGALGSRRTHEKRVAALVEAGLPPSSIERIHAPIGLDLGGRRPEEIALSIASQVVAARHGKA